ncbi:MAG: hypothetical protein H0S79_11955 [Anaerolineaceae bacterium]|nr:hypothetical protein [Anaerolineaceae bacterium]
MPIQTFAEFLLYIVPGYLTIQIYRWRYPVKEKGSFFEIASSVTIGVFIVYLGIWIDKHVFCYYFVSNSDGLPTFRFLVLLFSTSILCGLLLIGQRELRNYLSKTCPKLNWIASGVDSDWVKINSKNNDDWAVVFLDDGSVYLGWIKNYTYNPNFKDQDFILSNAKRLNNDLSVMYVIDGIGVYLKTENVKRIEFVNGTPKAS